MLDRRLSASIYAAKSGMSGPHYLPRHTTLTQAHPLEIRGGSLLPVHEYPCFVSETGTLQQPSLKTSANCDSRTYSLSYAVLSHPGSLFPSTHLNISVSLLGVAFIAPEENTK